MNLIFVSSDQYPDGGAAANRHMAFARGLSELDNKVTFILLSEQKPNEQQNGFKGIGFILPPKPRYRINSRVLMKLIIGFLAVRNGIKHIKAAHSAGLVDAIILLDTYVWLLIPFMRLARKMNIKVIHERTEYPFVVERKGIAGKIHSRIYNSFVVPGFDGIYVISIALRNYFESLTKRKVPVSVLNMVVDPSRFEGRNSMEQQNGRYIAYCGSMEPGKDGVDILIRSFGIAINEQGGQNDLKLMLIGDISDEELHKRLDRIIEESRCTGKVIFTGLVSRSRIPGYLVNAEALAMARPRSKQAEGGFPTKLGEYLSTGKPVIVTDVGEIGLFLKDGYNAFVAKADDVTDFAIKISQVFADYSKAAEIGLTGKKLVLNEFSYLVQAGKLAGFIKSLPSPRLKNSRINNI